MYLTIYADFGNLSPEKKIVFLTMSNIMRVSALNKMLKNIKNYEEKLKNDSEQTPVKETEPLSNDKVTFNINSPNKNMDNVLNFDIVKN